MHLHYIHGHACIHNLMSIGADYDSDPYKQLLNIKKSYSSNSFVWASTPFNKPCDPMHYEEVCDDFGYKLQRIEHDWNSLSIPELWTLCGRFNWKEHIADLGTLLWDNSSQIYEGKHLNPEHFEYGIYTRLFKTSYQGSKIPTYEDYLKLIGLEC